MVQGSRIEAREPKHRANHARPVNGYRTVVVVHDAVGVPTIESAHKNKIEGRNYACLLLLLLVGDASDLTTNQNTGTRW